MLRGGNGVGGNGDAGLGLGGGAGLGGGIGGLTTSESSSPVLASTASIRAASTPTLACSALNPPSTAANVPVKLLIAAACAAACSASALVTLAFTAAWAANWVVTWAERRAKSEGGDGGKGGMGGGGGLDGGIGGDGGDLGGGGLGLGGGGDLGGGGLGLGGGGDGFGGGDVCVPAAPTLTTKRSGHKSTLSITRRGAIALRVRGTSTKRAAARRGGRAVVVGGWRSWSHKAQERWARRWRRIYRRSGGAGAGRKEAGFSPFFSLQEAVRE